MTDHLAGPGTADPVAELSAVHKLLLTIEANATVLLSKEDDRVPLGKAALAAIAHAGQGDEPGRQAAILDIVTVQATATKYARARDVPNATAVGKTVLAALPRLQAIRLDGGGSGAVLSVAKGFDTVTRHPDVDVDRTVTITRSGDTRGLLVVPLQVSGDAALALAEGLPAAFFDKDTEAQARLTFGRLPPAAARVAAGPAAGRAAIVPPAGTSLGAVPGFDFRVLDEPPPPVPSGKNPFRSRLPANATPLPWVVDGLSMNWPTSGGADYQRAIGHYPVVSSGGSHNGGRTDTWTGIAGGPISSNLSDYDKGGVAGTQADFGGLGLGISFQIVKPGGGFVVATIESSQRNGRPTWEAMAAAGVWDNHHYALGRRMWAEVKKRGFKGWQFVSRFDKESNGGGYGLTAANTQAYGRALGRAIHFFDQGYADGGADSPALHVLGFARHDQLGPLEPIVPTYGGKVVVHAIDISMHPPATGLGALAGRPFADQVTGVRAWIRGDYDPRPCYAPDHKDPQYSALAVAKKLGILISNFETSPREDGNLACPISAAAWQALHDFWSENADMVGGVGVYAKTVLDKNLSVPGWAAGVDRYVSLWSGRQAGAARS